MFVDEGDELLIGQSEYIVLNKYTEDGKKYIFVANVNNPEINLSENFDETALELLLLSEDDCNNNDASNTDEYVTDKNLTGNNGYNNPINNGHETYNLNQPVKLPEIENLPEFVVDQPVSYEGINNIETNINHYFDVEKEPSRLEKILEILFLK